MQLIRYDAGDAGAVSRGRDIINRCRGLETPWLPPLTLHRREMEVRHGWDGPPDRHFLGHVDGVAVAVAQLEIGEWDNRDFAWVHLFVDPRHRRRGHGSAALAELVRCSVELGCTKIGGSGWELSATVGFAARHGFERASAEIFRRQHPQELPSTRAQELHDEAAAVAADYELVRIAGRTPAARLPALVSLAEAINDAPVDDLEVEDEVFTAARVAGYENATIESGHRLYRVVARHRASGTFAGHTVVAVDTESPEQAHQHDTSVLRAHRGHRLGLLVKADMMRWLADAEPQLRSVDTWNAETNDHMIAVNDRLGYRVLGREVEFQRRL